MLRFVIFGTDTANLAALERSDPSGVVSFVAGDGPEVSRAERLDALLVTLMAAERFGVGPPYPVGKSFVIRTPPADVERGLPRYIVAGVALCAIEEPRNRGEELRLFIAAGIDAIAVFNEGNPHDPISRIGIPAAMLLDEKIGPAASMQILMEEVQAPRRCAQPQWLRVCSQEQPAETGITDRARTSGPEGRSTTEQLEAEFRRATTLRDAGDLAAARALLEQLSVRHPDAFAVWLVLGGVQMSQADYAAAADSLAVALELRPRAELASLAMFHTLTHLGKVHDAFAEMRRFLSFRPESREYALLRAKMGEVG